MLDRKTLLFYICCFLLLSRFGNPQVTPSDGATAPSAKALVAANAPTITGESGAPPDPNAAASTLNPGDTSPGPIVSTTDTGSVPAPTP